MFIVADKGKIFSQQEIFMILIYYFTATKQKSIYKNEI